MKTQNNGWPAAPPVHPEWTGLVEKQGQKMKTIEQVRTEEETDVYTLGEFLHLYGCGALIPYDGYGYFHDGEKKTDICVWDESLDIDYVLDNCPYVVWYNR